ncbi:MAG: hypothetical protein ACOCO5_04870 [Segatella copri]
MEVIRDILSENGEFLTYKSAVARWMNTFIHSNVYFDDEAKTVASVLGITTNEVFSIAQRIIQEGALPAKE